MKNNIKNAKAFLKEMGCDINSHIIDYDRISTYLVTYTNRVKSTKRTAFNYADLKSLRKSNKLTLRQVEDLTGISNAYLSQLENGKIKKPSYDTVGKLFDLYYEKAINN